MVTIAITGWLEGEQVLDRLLTGIEARATDWSAAGPAIDAVFHQIARQALASEGASEGAPWAPLAEATQAERRRLGYGPAHPILRRTGALARSLTTLNGDAISVHAPTYYARGSGVEYFVYHQSRRPRTRLPRRPVINLTADERYELTRPIRLWLRGLDPARTATSDAAFAAQFPRTTGGLA